MLVLSRIRRTKEQKGHRNRASLPERFSQFEFEQWAGLRDS